MNSRKTLPSLTLAVRFTAKAAELLTDFANTHTEDWKRFGAKWEHSTSRSWRGGEATFQKTQEAVRQIWAGKMKGYEDQLVARGLSLYESRQEEGWFDSNEELFNVHWGGGFIWASPRDLGDYVWLSLLQYSQKLAICGNKDNGCPAPYFIRRKKTDKFCSPECAAPSQREFKRQWFRENGEEWRKTWEKNRKQQRTKSRKKGR